MSAKTLTTVLTLPVSASRDHIRGPATASVTLVEYGDYECPFCASAKNIVDAIAAHMGDRLRFAFRHFPLTTIHPRAQIAAEAAEAAGAQHRFWDMHDTLYTNQQRLEDSHLIAYASELRLDVGRFRNDLLSHAHLPKIREDFMTGVRSGVNGTPTFYINNARHDGSLETPDLLAAVQRAADVS